MKAKTRLFGDIDIADDKIITMDKGMIGFPQLNHFALIFDEEKECVRPPLCGFSLWMILISHFRL